MNIDQVLVVERPGISPQDRNAFNSAVDVFRDEVKKNPLINGMAASVTIPGKQREFKVVLKKYGSSDEEGVTLRVNSMDYDFLDVFKMKLIAGRMFAEDHPTDRDTAVIVSEAATRMLGFKKPEDALGQTLAIGQWQWNPIIVGVVNDYHQVSLKKAIDPAIFYCSPYGGEFYSFRIKAENLSETIDHVRKSWDKAFPGNPFDYFFLDDYFNKQYENERKFGKLFSTFAILAVFVGCLGLFGLSAYTATQRTKEIGIRKVLGSSEGSIFVLLSKEYVMLVIIAIVVAAPIVWLTMNSWITSFPYRTTISVTVFLISGIAVLFVAISTVSFQTLKAARTNPVDSLRHE
jgi:putative ABC transport system permease protein